MPGAALSLSANGNQDAILWVSVSPCHDTTNEIRAGTLMAFKADDLKLLWFEDGTNPAWLDICATAPWPQLRYAQNSVCEICSSNNRRR